MKVHGKGKNSCDARVGMLKYLSEVSYFEQPKKKELSENESSKEEPVCRFYLREQMN